ncbi:vacuolar protein-sorting-associated protein 25 [Galendromus occidentalis]|uniref:Vacuolar protein-sorting-associated protein 25 n=1 Tax=Galendromus occidentalis TaxID=34638 RepID=A0AAJ6VZS2_9ACAR|nr:vacuolar protein-sorting-associated protein 25 [Galendromus occidentalis]
MSGFTWPWEYSFPPFFTVQPNSTTRAKQMDSWTSLICAYCQFHKITILNLGDAEASDLFNNKTLKRKLSSDAVLEVAQYMTDNGKAQWLDGQNSILVLWRSLEEWAKLLHDFAIEAGLTNSVCTLFELVQGDDTTKEEFYGLDIRVLKVFLKCLEEQGRAELIGDDEGVKFFV